MKEMARGLVLYTTELFAIVFGGATAIHLRTQVFAAMDSIIPMNDDDPIPLLKGKYPGRYEDDLVG